MYLLKESQKEELRIPLGKVVKNVRREELGKKIVSVGDAVTIWLLKHKINPDISIVDYKIERKTYEGKINAGEKIIKVKNPAGRISRQLWSAISNAYKEKNKIMIEVDGEEDLAALPAIYLAPPGGSTTVIYGLPSRGMVIVRVGEKERKKVEEFLKKMERDENGD